MDTMAISKFKATCLAVVQRVKRTGRPILITRFGEPMAEVVPPSRRASKGAWLGSMQGSVEVLGDEIGPALDANRWHALRK